MGDDPEDADRSAAQREHGPPERNYEVFLFYAGLTILTQCPELGE
jgi:hypothetical protein